MTEGASRDLTGFNAVASAVLAALGFLALFWLVPEHVPVRAGPDRGLNARFMPTVAAGVLVALALLLGANVAFRLARGLGPMPEDNEESEVQGFGWRETQNALILLAGSAVYVALLQLVGLVAASAVALLACLYCGGVRNWPFMILTSLGLPLALGEILWRTLLVIVPPFPFSF